MPAIPAHNMKTPEPKGHAIGFVRTQAECDDITNALSAAGFSTAAINILEGEDGLRQLKDMLGGTLWGETSEDVLKQGVIELSRGHLAIVVAARNRENALLAANTAKQRGGYSFSHFGLLTDERITR